MGVLVESRFPRVVSLKRCCGFSTPVRSGTCCRRAIRNDKTVHRRFQTWCRDEVLRRVLTDVANELRDRGALDEEECFIDATFVMAKGGGAEVGTTKRGKGMKIMAIVDRHGLPLWVSTHAANHHEVRLVQLCFDFYMIEAKPENLIGDRAYDSDPLDEELRRDGVEMIAPHRANRIRPPTLSFTLKSIQQMMGRKPRSRSASNPLRSRPHRSEPHEYNRISRHALRSRARGGSRLLALVVPSFAELILM